MIDYTQLAFASPVQVTDPIPSVADYLDDYTAREQAWYGQWAYPYGGGRWGANPASFGIRGQWTSDLLPEEALPRIIRGRDLTTGENGEAYGMGSTGQEDRPVGALVRDPAEMSNEALWSEYMAYTDPVAPYVGSLPGMLGGLMSGAGALVSVPAGLAARQSMENRATEVMNEMGRRMGALYPPQARASQIESGGGISGASVPVQGGTRVFTGGDVLPVSYEPEREQRGGGDRSGVGPGGNEVGAGGWAGEGGL